MAQLLGSLLVSLGLESGSFKSGLSAAEKQFASAQKKFEKIGAKLTNVGKNLTLGLTLPIAAAAAAAVKGAQEQAAAMGQVEAALTSMGSASGKTAGELAKAADAMEMRSLFNADVILTKVTANLLTFGNVANEQFDRAQQAAIDMATRMGSDPQSAAIMLGKALNDPIKGITALTRVGVQFTDSQKAQIKAFSETGQIAKAQGVILGEVEKQFKGAAQAAADTQPWRQAEVAIGQAMDKIGEAILPVIPVITDAIKSVAGAFTELSPGMQKFIIIAGGLAAALGPFLAVAGSIVKLAAPLAASLTMSAAATAAAGTAAGGASVGFGALAAAAAPWIALAAGIGAAGYAIYTNWDKIAPVLDGLWKTVSETLGPPFQQIITTISTMLSDLWSGPFGAALREAGMRIAAAGKVMLETFGPVLLGALKLILQTVANVLTALLDFGRAIGSLFEGDIKGAFTNLGSAINNLFGGLPAKVIGWISQMVQGIGQWMGAKLNAIWDGVKKKVAAVTGWFKDMYVAVVGNSYVPDMVDEIGDNMRRLDKELTEPANKAAKATEERFQQMQERVRGILDRLFPEQRAEITYQQEKADLQEGLSGEAETGAIKALDSEKLKASPAFATASSGLSGGFATLTRGFEQAAQVMEERAAALRDKVVESFDSMVQGALDAVQNLIGAIKGGGFLDILGAVLGVVGQGFKIYNSFAGARAEGGPVSSGRSYLVGERGPELFTPSGSGKIVPNNELGGGRVEVRIVPTPYFDAHVDNRAGRVVQAAAPSIASAGASGGMAQMRRSGARRVA